MNEATIPTWNLLPLLGFQPDEAIVYSEIRPGLSFDFGNVKLSASAVTSQFAGEVISLTGIMATPDTVAEIHFDLPRRVESLRQCAAWIVWYLDQQPEGHTFRAARALPWLEEARLDRRLLPWVLSQEKFTVRPQCTVRREWLRLGLKTLDEHLAALPDKAIIAFRFDGYTLSIESMKGIIAFPAEGLPWTVLFKAEARAFRRSPKRRFMHKNIGISIWGSHIQIGPLSSEGGVESLDAGGILRIT